MYFEWKKALYVYDEVMFNMSAYVCVPVGFLQFSIKSSGNYNYEIVRSLENMFMKMWRSIATPIVVW